MITCPQCSKENQDHYKFCLGCGTKLPAAGVPAPAPAQPTAPLHQAPAPSAPPPAAPGGGSLGTDQTGQQIPAMSGAPAPCGSCGTENPPGFRFCGRCGAKLEDPAPPPGVAAPQAAPPEQMGSARTVFVDASSAPPLTPPGAAPHGGAVAAPAPVTVRAHLVLLRDDGSDGGMLALEGGPERIGRNYGPPFDSDAYLDPDHVNLTVREDGLKIDDPGSLNGVYVKLTEKIELQDNDQFRVGQELLRYQDLPEPTAAPDGTEKMGSPNPGYWGRVSVVVEPNRDCAAEPIKDEGLGIGREDGDLTFPEDGYVSGAHCRIVGDDSGVYLEDLGSSNGTYLRVRNGQVIPFGSLVLVGQQLFRLDLA